MKEHELSIERSKEVGRLVDKIIELKRIIEKKDIERKFLYWVAIYGVLGLLSMQ